MDTLPDVPNLSYSAILVHTDTRKETITVNYKALLSMYECYNWSINEQTFTVFTYNNLLDNLNVEKFSCYERNSLACFLTNQEVRGPAIFLAMTKDMFRSEERRVG